MPFLKLRRQNVPALPKLNIVVVTWRVEERLEDHNRKIEWYRSNKTANNGQWRSSQSNYWSWAKVSFLNLEKFLGITIRRIAWVHEYWAQSQ